jgi:hypothetical protein
MKQQKSIWIALDKEKFNYGEMRTLWDDNITDYKYDIEQTLLSWLEENWDSPHINKESPSFPVWVSESNPEYDNFDKSTMWSLYKVNVKYNPSFSLGHYTDDEISE